jgi:hypothetical protein
VKRVLAVNCLLLLCLAPAAQADHLVEGRDSARCGSKRVTGVKALAQSSESIVFEKTKVNRYGSRLPYAFGCVKKSGPIRRLPVNPDSFYRVRGAAVAGRFALLVKRSEEGEFDYWDNVVTFDLAAGRTVAESPAVSGSAFPDSYVASYVLKRNGSSAWIGQDLDDGRREVWKREAGASTPALLDSSAGVDATVPVRLSPDRRRVVWRSGGSERSASID